ncbi:MAG: hypothetical protein HC893_03935 [Chloroflexaceae bacterium]|nr:hypothetical protein [Chloroflexaceae bacterium]
MSKLFIRVLSFVSKELNEIRRQPRLILSLILGPFLILLLFGAGYRSNRPILRAVLVVPADVQAEIPMDDVRRILEANLELVDVRTDPGTAMEELEEGSIDVVGIFPSNIEERVLEGDQSLVEFKYNEINPINEQWIQYLAYAQVNEINRALLLQATSRAQDEAVPIRDLLAEAQTNLSRMQEGLSEVEQANLERYLPQLREAIDILGTAPILVAQADAGRSDAMEIRRELVRLRDELLILEQALEEGTIAEQQQRIAFVQDQLVEVQDAANILTSLPPEVIVSPLRQEVETCAAVRSII